MIFVNAKSILSAKNGMNVYRGCSHGCIYCDSRSLCYNMNHILEDIEVKQNAPELLRLALSKKRNKCMIGTGSMCDPYMHCEAELEITKKCLEIINDYGFGVSLLTKSNRILRDIDLIESINNKSKAVVQITLTTFNEELCRIIEPNVSTTKERSEVLRQMQERNIPTVVWLSPILPFINDTEENLRGILDCCFNYNVIGIINFGFGTTMRSGSREYFYAKLDEFFPGLKNKYINCYGSSYECLSPNNKALMQIFISECEKHNVMHNPYQIFDYLSFLPENKQYSQLSLFDK